MDRGDRARTLCLKLIQADTEREVVDLLEAAGYWRDPRLWRWLGDEEYNYSSVGNQQSRAEQAILEKLVNSIDAKLTAAARIEGYLPHAGDTAQKTDAPVSVQEARVRFFGDRLTDLEGLSRHITVAATGSKPTEGNKRPSFTIVDDGEGQTPDSMPNTILSLHKGNKDRIRFVQGKFNMGGTGVLEFCGMDHNLQLVVSKRHPALLSNPISNPNDEHWSFTVIRREDPIDGKSSRFTYLAPIGADAKQREGSLLHFAADSLKIFPDKNVAYARETQWGTLIKLYEYDARRFGTNMMFSDGLMYRARLLLPEPALPIRFHECRAYSGDPHRSFDTTMVGLVETLQRDFDSPKRDSVEWFDKLEFRADGERFSARIYLFKNRKAAEVYRRDEGIVFVFNGQCHAVMTKDFFRRKKVKQDYLWHSLLMFVDCTQISPRAQERLFMNSRDRLRDGDLRAKLESELEDLLARHEELKELASERRKRELAEQPKTSESMARVIENLLARNPTLAALLGQGLRIKNPYKPESAGAGVVGFIGKRFPTRFHFKGLESTSLLKRDAYMNSRVRITFETDAANDYFKRESEPGEFVLYRVSNGSLAPVADYQRPRLYNGFAHLSLSLPNDATAGDEIVFRAHITDPSRIEPFINEFSLHVKEERVPSGGGGGGRTTKGTDPGDEKGSSKGGNNQSQDSHLDIPDPREVYEKDWTNNEPEFDRFTGMRIKVQPDAPEDDDRYDYFINMDNIYLQTFLKAKPKFANALKLRFKVGMTLVALSILHQEQMRKKAPVAEDMPDGTVDVRDRVAQVTSALAPFLLPLVESVSELDAEEDEVSESAGEAA